MIFIKQVGFIGLILTLFIACTANQKIVTSTKLSISEKLKENNHLPITERIALYHQLKKEQPNHYNFEDENELDSYAYQLLNNDLQEEAIEVFKLNIAQFPTSGKAHYNLADAYSNLSYKYRELAEANRKKANKIWSILEMDESWGREIFHFPIRFAKEIPYKGIEDARFPKGWSDTTSNYFFTYLFGWNVNLTAEITVDELESNMKLYFDGLMESVNRNEAINPKITSAKFKKTNEHTFTGTVQVYDAFTTKQPLSLNAIVTTHYCESKKNAQILFHFSPKDFDHEVWSVLKTVKFQDDICNF